jgi:glyoxylate/hydroxypyruvate reductase A
MNKSRIVVIKCGAHLIDAWVKNMSSLLPNFDIKRWDDVYDYENVEYVIGWCPDALWINRFTNIKAAVSIGSGVDHIENLDKLRENIALIRTVSPDLIQRMREFATLCVLAWHRQFPSILVNNNDRQWKRFAVETAENINVGVLGFGGMGKAVAETLSCLGYNVSVWASQERKEVGYKYYFGNEMLSSFAEKQNVLICLLPLTNKTQNILNKTLLGNIKPGGCLINLARGGHLVDDDLIELIRKGHLSAAFLDGFREEPLPDHSRFWDEKNIYITCHSASYISPEMGPKIIADNIKKFDQGDFVEPLYNRKLGY